MSEAGAPKLSAAVREQTLARFEEHRRAWRSNEALRASYGGWYRRLRRALPALELGPWVELGSGPGFAKELIPELLLTDVVQAPWHDRCVSAEELPFDDESLGALVLFDVLHHLESPARFFVEATRVLRPGGRLLLCEPYIGPLSHLVYGLFHEEPVDMRADPWGDEQRAGSQAEKDPFASNQAIPTLIFCRNREAFHARYPRLHVVEATRLAGLSYASTGGFSRGPMLPVGLWKAIYSLEQRLPELAFRLIGFRMIVVIEKR